MEPLLLVHNRVYSLILGGTLFLSRIGYNSGIDSRALLPHTLNLQAPAIAYRCTQGRKHRDRYHVRPTANTSRSLPDKSPAFLWHRVNWKLYGFWQYPRICVNCVNCVNGVKLF